MLVSLPNTSVMQIVTTSSMAIPAVKLVASLVPGALRRAQESSVASTRGTRKPSLPAPGQASPLRAGSFSSPPAFSLSSPCSCPCRCVLLNPIRKRGEFQAGFFREPRLHTKLADVPFSIPAALSLHTRNGKALCGCAAGCSELKSAGGT